MRVISGKYKGRRLVTPKDLSIRPTSDRVKESVFSSINHKVRNANFFDLCSGTGNIGIEALSRGADKVTFLDHNIECHRLIEMNLLKCGIEKKSPQIKLIHSGITKGITILQNCSEIYDLIYFDPPYNAGLYTKCLSFISAASLLKPSGLIIVENEKRTDLPNEIGIFSRDRFKQYGNTHVTFFRHQNFSQIAK